MAFIPGVYHLYVLVKKWTNKKRERRRTRKYARRQTLDGQSVAESNSESTFMRDIQKMNKKRDKFKFSVAITTEVLDLITLLLTLLLFLCSTAVTLCVNADDKIVDYWHNAPDANGELASKENVYTQTKNETVEIPSFCKVFPDRWFNGASRFNNDCIESTLQLNSDNGQLARKIPHPIYLPCLNPLEVAALIAIAVSMGLHLLLLAIFVIVRRWQRKESSAFLNRRKLGKKISYKTKKARSTRHGILEHKDDGIFGTYKSSMHEVYLPNLTAIALQDSGTSSDDTVSTKSQL